MLDSDSIGVTVPEVFVQVRTFRGQLMLCNFSKAGPS